MDTFTQIVVSGLTLGAMYAVSTLALSLVWGSLNLLNMAQGALLVIGGYAAYAVVTTLGLPIIVGFLGALVVGGLAGAAMYYGVIRFMIGKAGFETNVIIATVGLALIFENVILKFFGAYPLTQPIMVEGGFFIGKSHVRWQNLVILVVAVVLTTITAQILNRTRMGRAIRATSQNRDAAQLMGVPVRLVFVQVLVISGMLAAVSGIMLSSITTLAPTMGYDPMLKAFIVCVIAGLGNVAGALYAAFILGIFESFVQYLFGVRFGFPALLLLVIVALIWRPYGVFGRRKVVRCVIRRDIIIGLVVLAALIAIPFIWPTRYIIGQLILFTIWATVVTQWNLVFGVAGIFSLAQMALFAMGGYVTGMLGLYFGWPLWFGMIFGGLAAVVFSLLIGLACLRLRGAYVALLTLAIAQGMYLLIITDTACFFMDGVTCRNFTGGTRGLAKYGDFGFREILGNRYFSYGNYFLGLTVLTLATTFSIFIIRSPLGLAFRALRDDGTYAVARGISRFKHQLLVFAACAFFTGLAGAVYAGHFRVMGANTLYLSLLLLLLSMMVVGGVGSAWGPLVGSAALMVADELLKEIVEYRQIGLGLILIGFVVLWPTGLVGVMEAIWSRIRRPGHGAAAPLADPGAAKSDAD